MSRTATHGSGPTRPVWLVPTRLLERTTTVVAVLALIAGVAAEPRHPSPGYLAFAVGAAGVLLASRRWPAALLLVVVAPTLAVVLGSEPVALWSITSFTAFLLTLRGAPAVLTAVVASVGNATAQWLTIGELTSTAAVTPGIAALTAVAAAAVGSAVRGNNRYWLALEQRARDAEVGRELEVRRSIAEERLRIARDLHDSVGHAAAVVSMRLGAAEVQLPPQADGVRTELAAARAGVQEILREMQQILQVLRIGGEAEALTPTPGAGGIPELVRTFRAAGLVVHADLDNLQRSLPADVGAAVYRIVQEALTNAQKHGPGEVRLRVDVGEALVRIQVENPAVTPAASVGDDQGPEGGHGLIGMRERAGAAGGWLEAQAEGSVFTLCAELPVRGGSR